MGFWPFHGGDQQVFHQVRQFSLDELEYAFEFSEKEQVLLQRAFDNQEKGGWYSLSILSAAGPTGLMATRSMETLEFESKWSGAM